MLLFIQIGRGAKGKVVITIVHLQPLAVHEERRRARHGRGGHLPPSKTVRRQAAQRACISIALHHHQHNLPAVEDARLCQQGTQGRRA